MARTVAAIPFAERAYRSIFDLGKRRLITTCQREDDAIAITEAINALPINLDTINQLEKALSFTLGCLAKQLAILDRGIGINTDDGKSLLAARETLAALAIKKENAALIVEAVNSHAALVERVAKLESLIDVWLDDITHYHGKGLVPKYFDQVIAASTALLAKP